MLMFSVARETALGTAAEPFHRQFSFFLRRVGLNAEIDPESEGESEIFVVACTCDYYLTTENADSITRLPSSAMQFSSSSFAREQLCLCEHMSCS